MGRCTKQDCKMEVRETVEATEVSTCTRYFLLSYAKFTDTI